MVQLLTESEASELLRLTPRQVSRLARRGELPSIALPGGEVRFDPADLLRFVESCKRHATGILPASNRSEVPS